MAQIFQIYPIESTVKDNTGKVVERNRFFHYPQEAEDALEVLLTPHSISVFAFTNTLNTNETKILELPWVSIVYPHDYPIGRFFAGIRKSPGEALYSNFWRKQEEIPGIFSKQYLSQIYIFTKQGLISLSHRAPFLEPCRIALKDYDGRYRWLLLADDIPENLVENMRTGVLFQRG